MINIYSNKNKKPRKDLLQKNLGKKNSKQKMYRLVFISSAFFLPFIYFYKKIKGKGKKKGTKYPQGFDLNDKNQITLENIYEKSKIYIKDKKKWKEKDKPIQEQITKLEDLFQDVYKTRMLLNEKDHMSFLYIYRKPNLNLSSVKHVGLYVVVFNYSEYYKQISNKSNNRSAIKCKILRKIIEFNNFTYYKDTSIYFKEDQKYL